MIFKQFIYSNIMKVNATKNVMIFPFYFPTLPGEEFAYRNWDTIEDIPIGWMYGSSDSIYAKSFDCEIRSEGSKVFLEAVQDAIWESPGREYFNAYVLYKKNSGKLILFNSLDPDNNTYFITDGKLTLIFDRPVMLIDCAP